MRYILFSPGVKPKIAKSISWEEIKNGDFVYVISYSRWYKILDVTNFEANRLQAEEVPSELQVTALLYQ